MIFKEFALDALGVTIYLFTELFGAAVCFFITIYLLLYTKLWWLTIIYLTWVYAFDFDKCESGGRPLKWVRDLPLWDYARNYFPVRLHKLDGVELDPGKNYLFCCFPHGFINAGPPISLCPTSSGFSTLFPHHKPYVIALKVLISFPFHRDLLLGLGLVSSSYKSISYLMSKPGGGNVAALMVGGAEEVVYVKPGTYTFNVKNRRGFVKLALKCGSPLVPVVSFGENDIIDQFNNSEGTVIRNIQKWMKKTFGFAMIVPKGRGFIQPSIIPYKRPINLVGKIIILNLRHKEK